MKRVCVVGLGYIGLPTAAVLAGNGYFIHGVDVNNKAVELINKGKPHIFEPDLEKKLKKAVENGLLKASISPSYADIFIIAVPTPFKEEHKPDLTYVETATKSIAPFIKPGNIIILESTSPVGTTEKMVEWIKELRSDIEVDGKLNNTYYLAHCPERVLPGKILDEIVSNDRIVGGINDESTDITAEFYRGFVKGKILKTSARTAEMTKLTENSFRDINIAFANELSIICDEFGIDVWELIKLANHHPRVNILQPGPGVGGHCIAVDPWFIIDSIPEKANLIYSARKVNDSKPYFVVEKIKKVVQQVENPIITCLGLSFKANIDDLRESPSIKIVKEIASYYKGKVCVAEPHIENLPDNLKDCDVELVNTLDGIVRANIVVILVDHDYFKAIDEEIFKGKIVVDTRGILTNRLTLNPQYQ